MYKCSVHIIVQCHEQCNVGVLLGAHMNNMTDTPVLAANINCVQIQEEQKTEIFAT